MGDVGNLCNWTDDQPSVSHLEVTLPRTTRPARHNLSISNATRRQATRSIAKGQHRYSHCRAM
jgi:hypothetical protein